MLFLSYHIHLIPSHTCNSFHFIFISFHRIPAILIISYSSHSIAYLQFLSFHIHLIASHTCNSYHFIFISFHRIPAILIISYSSHSISCQCMPCHFMSSHAFFILIPSHSIQIVLKLIPVHVISMSSHAIETHQILSYPTSSHLFLLFLIVRMKYRFQM